MVLSSGQILQNRYRIVAALGQGGMGAVYRAQDLRLNVSVALKEMAFQTELSPHHLAQLRQQFQQEAQVLARLKHSHLVRVSDFFEEGGKAYLVMEFVEGESLAQRITRDAAIREDIALDWARQLLDALQYCHSQGVIHRDIKPHNIIICPDNQVVLVDFGLAKLWNPYDPLTRTAMRGMGTPEYAPPEQYDAGGSHTDARSDIYSLGATLYHALTGEAPPTATQRMVNPQALKPPKALNPTISTLAEYVILKALEPEPGQRFQTAQEMASALGGTRRIPPQPVASAGQRTKVMPGGAHSMQRRKPVLLWAGLGAVLGLVVVGVLLFGSLLRGRDLENGTVQDTIAPTAAPTSIATTRPTGTALPTRTPMPTHTVAPTVAATATALHTRTPTKTPTPTKTATPAPTATPTQPPPPTKAPTATYVPPPSPTPVPACASPQLIEPPDGVQYDTWEKPLLRWSYNCALGQYDHYDVRVWREGNPHYGVNWTKDPVFELDCQAWYDDYGAGRFCWSIAIVRGQNGVLESVLVDEGPARCLEIRPGIRPSPTPNP